MSVHRKTSDYCSSWVYWLDAGDKFVGYPRTAITFCSAAAIGGPAVCSSHFLRVPAQSLRPTTTASARVHGGTVSRIICSTSSQLLRVRGALVVSWYRYDNFTAVVICRPTR